jgi:RNA polymerase sigma-70 factor (ECF subfamily)
MRPSPQLRLLVRQEGEPRDEPADDVLMALAAGGDQAAFVRLVKRYERRIRSFCRLLLRDEAQARDVAQDVFLKAWERRAAYRPGGRMKEYLFTIARHHCHSVLRKRAVRAWFGFEHASEEELSVPPPGPDAIAASQTETLVARALQRLPEKFRVPLALRFVEGMAYEEIAQVIGRTPSAARSRIFYGLKALAAILPPEAFQ